jgi:hypothetical protein
MIIKVIEKEFKIKNPDIIEIWMIIKNRHLMKILKHYKEDFNII